MEFNEENYMEIWEVIEKKKYEVNIIRHCIEIDFTYSNDCIAWAILWFLMSQKEESFMWDWEWVKKSLEFGKFVLMKHLCAFCCSWIFSEEFWFKYIHKYSMHNSIL